MGSSSWSTILFMVSVPVLSEQSTVIPATSSIEESRVTMASLRARARAPRAMVVTETTGSAIGMDATRRTTANASASRGGAPRSKRTIKEIATRSVEPARRAFVMAMMILSKWEISWTRLIMEAVLPKNVWPPVAMTTASASPRTQLEPILGSSPHRILAGMDSPVSAAWSISNSPLKSASRRQSAGTAPPACSTMRSPTTTSAPSMVE
mmetsp:Transcript_26421/g.88864  ORF Transcript_26421/g.88864 Transcript_26421/m.88864 type:complete len:209 (+) Transcript_26421:733-1359(+)